MGLYNYQNQIVGPFAAKEELYTIMKEKVKSPVEYISHLGIQTEIGNTLFINGKEVEIGKTGIYEIGNTRVTSIYFAQDVDKNTIIDYVTE